LYIPFKKPKPTNMNILNKSILVYCLLIFLSTSTNAQIGIGTSSPDPSAKLEISSTTKGFLPPRMKRIQRDAINSPAAGLTIWCTNCGKTANGVIGEMQVFNGAEWTNHTGGTASGQATLAIGDFYQGGKIAYILVSGDPGYDANEQHGLIAATVDQSTGIEWGPNNTATGATATAIGSGLANTNTIIASQGASANSYAAATAKAYRGGGYSDWYLPSKDELQKLYENKIALGNNFSTTKRYHSSSEAVRFQGDTWPAWQILFGDGSWEELDKLNQFNVRAVRSF